jgi:hypothetical protein
MTLWALRITIPGKGPWLLIDDEKNMERLQFSPRRRKKAAIEDFLF